ncbi:MAG TPA: hypothetical protein VFW11_22350 [Cyclobacteriaceae bacterium]|nr:hypothetical protein [Cyclobacteriaceae bacterium]
MDKISLKVTLIKAHQETLQRLKDDYVSYQSGDNPEEAQDADDFSHKTQTEEYLEALEHQIRQRESEIETLRALDFGKKAFATEGAVALVNGQ